MKLTNPRILISLVVIGILAGLTGIALSNLLHYIQHVAFDYNVVDHYSFRLGVDNATGIHRVIILLLCGAIGGIGWYGIHNYGSGIRDVKDVIVKPEEHMPIVTTICHAILQIITVAMGSPLGREAAPREMSIALTSGWFKLTHFDKGLDNRTVKVMLACASGAGLTAVYNTPLASTIFVLETLLLEWDLTYLGAAFLTCSVSTLIIRFGLGDTLQYPLPTLEFSNWLILWAILAGPCIAFGVHTFRKSAAKLPKINRKSSKMILVSILAFGLIGIMSIYFPEILGNGKPGNQVTFTNAIDWQYSFGLYMTKWVALLLATIAGAYGGRISPSMMLGSTMCLILAVVWNQFLPMLPIEVCAVVGAVVFLGLNQNMHLTAIIFLIEMSRFSASYYFPICMCMATAIIALKYLELKTPINK